MPCIWNGQRIGGFVFLGGARQSLLRVAAVHHGPAHEALCVFEIVVDSVGIRRKFRLRSGPGDFERLRRLDRGPFGFRDHSDEAPFAHHLSRRREYSHRIFVHARRLGFDGCRTHDATVQHAGHVNVLRVGELRGELWWQIDARHRGADDLVIVRTFRANIGRDFEVPANAGGGDVHVEMFAADEVAIGNLFGSAGRADDSIAYHEFFRRNIEPARRHFQKLLSRGCGGLAQLRAGALDGAAACGNSLVDGLGGIAHFHLDVAEGNVELLRDNLAQRGYQRRCQDPPCW